MKLHIGFHIHKDGIVVLDNMDWANEKVLAVIEHHAGAEFSTSAVRALSAAEGILVEALKKEVEGEKA